MGRKPPRPPPPTWPGKVLPGNLVPRKLIFGIQPYFIPLSYIQLTFNFLLSM